MRTVLLVTFICIAFSAMAQRECASVEYVQQQKLIDPTFVNRINDIENFIGHQSSFAAKLNGEGVTVIRIPVIVHVIYKTSEQNISDAQIKSQIDALNRDYRRKNNDSINTPSRFKSIAADVQIEFVLASADPDGRATTGIVRRQTAVDYWKSDDQIKFRSQGGDDAWDSHSYLNFWVGNMKTLLGYSSVPGEANEKDGVVINYTAFGTINMAGAYNMGRTAVHEVGHWLGLKHIWGDTYCGDDLVNDTPIQGNFTSGCPSGFRSSCSNGTMGDMYMNYMDYTSDACVNLFTEGQKQRMLALFNNGGPRNSILLSKGLSQPWNMTAPSKESAVTVNSFKLYPNPATTEIVLNFDYDNEWIGKTISILNLNGTVVAKLQINSKTCKLAIAQLTPGIYFIQGDKGQKKIREKFIKM